MLYLTIIILVASAGLAVHVAWRDFMTWKIGNGSVLNACAAFVIFASAALFTGPPASTAVDIAGSAAAAALMLFCGFALWALKLFGAGDAKFLAPIGLFTGWNYLLPFALNLVVFAVIALLILKIPLPYGLGGTAAGMRLDEIRKTGKVPYGVIMVAAMLLTGAMKYAPIFQAILRTG